MAALSDLRNVARTTGEKRFPRGALADVRVEPATSPYGDDILQVQFIMDSASINQLDGDTLIDTIMDLSRAFEALGDERRPSVNYLSPDEVDADDDPEA